MKQLSLYSCSVTYCFIYFRSSGSIIVYSWRLPENVSAGQSLVISRPTARRRPSRFRRGLILVFRETHHTNRRSEHVWTSKRVSRTVVFQLLPTAVSFCDLVRFLLCFSFGGFYVWSPPPPSPAGTRNHSRFAGTWYLSSKYVMNNLFIRQPITIFQHRSYIDFTNVSLMKNIVSTMTMTVALCNLTALIYKHHSTVHYIISLSMLREHSNMKLFWDKNIGTQIQIFFYS